MATGITEQAAGCEGIVTTRWKSKRDVGQTCDARFLLRRRMNRAETTTRSRVEADAASLRTAQNEHGYIAAAVQTDRIDELAKEWAHLFASVEGVSPFLSPSWNRPFLDHRVHGWKTMFLTVHHARHLVVVLPLKIRSVAGVQIAEPLTTGEPSYLGVLVAPGHEEGLTVLVEYVRQQRVFDIYRIKDLASIDKATHRFLTLLGEQGYASWQKDRRPCCAITLGMSFDEYLRVTKSTKRRSKLRNEEKRLHQWAQVAVEHYEGAEVTKEVLRRVVAIQQASWMKRRGAAVLGQPFYQELLGELAESGILHVWIQRLNEKDAAFVIGLVNGNRLQYYRTAFDLSLAGSMSVGKMLTMHVIREACERGISWFDFGHGRAEYKDFWATETYAVKWALVGRGMRGRLVMLGSILALELSQNQLLHKIWRHWKAWRQ